MRFEDTTVAYLSRTAIVGEWSEPVRVRIIGNSSVSGLMGSKELTHFKDPFRVKPIKLFIDGAVPTPTGALVQVGVHDSVATMSPHVALLD